MRMANAFGMAAVAAFAWLAGCSTSSTTRCESDAQCPESLPRCDTTKGLCVECLAATDCGTSCLDVCLDGKCSQVNACVTDSDCPQQHECLQGCCVPKTGCQSNDDCAAPTPVCDPASHSCVPCLVDGDCPAGRCVDKKCLTACQSDGDCSSPTGRCDTASGVCVQCLSGSDCTRTLPLCRESDHTCVECLDNAGCGPNEVCRDGSCEAGPTCTTDDQCDPGMICEGGTCITGCRSSRDCPSGWECIPSGVGDARVCAECQQDDDCPAGFRCRELRCEFFCTEEAHCLPLHCDTSSGQCVPCLEDGHCPSGTICEKNACVSGCRQDSACISGHCDLDTFSCVDCLANEHCPLGYICSERHCIEGCQSDRDCPQPLHCDTDAGATGRCVACLQNSHCQNNQVCRDGVCVFSCRESSDCTPPAPVCDTQNGVCVQCLTKDQCPLGNLCRDFVCVPGCESDRDCPVGSTCQGGQCRTVCVPTGPESCNGLDDDCDGLTDAQDSDLSLTLCERQDGVCAGSRHRADQCVNGLFAPCDATNYGPSFGTEVCDGLDSDCDGFGDEGLQLNCQNYYVCQSGQCVYAGSCTSDCQTGQTKCPFLDNTRVYVCRNTDTDPCLEWSLETCPAFSTCDILISNRCECTYEECGGACCAEGQLCGPNDVCCMPSCPARTCGSNGCGGSCTCEYPNDRCENGVCRCTPSCAGKECGTDGCGGTCPNLCGSLEHCGNGVGVCDYAECNGVCCGSGQVCNATTGSCCTPACTGKECGPDGCGHTCGTCYPGDVCQNGQCVCVPNCTGRECGSDGCGGSCGSCDSNYTCYDGQCCYPWCYTECGSDGCGGSCGTCPENETCNTSGYCVCAYDTCGTVCCSSDQRCYQGSCCDKQCGSGTSSDPFTCGADSCGGSCPSCTSSYGPGSTCNSQQVCVCNAPSFYCASLLFPNQCCSQGQSCNMLFGCL